MGQKQIKTSSSSLIVVEMTGESTREEKEKFCAGWLVEQGLTSHSTQLSLGHFGDDVFTGQMTQPTVSKH